jgi:hypothetical protein
MPSLARKKFFVYELSMDRPGKYVFYVGKGSGKRPNDHGREAAGFSLSLKCAVIRYLYAHNDNYWINYVYDTDDEEEAYWYEMKTITLYPHGTLCNVFASYRPTSPYRMEMKEFNGWPRGFLVDAKTGKRIYESSRQYTNSILSDLAGEHDRIVLPPYLKKICYQSPAKVKKRRW